MTFQEALAKLESLCSLQEKCSYDILNKLNKWGIVETDQQKILDILKKEKFLDDVRYASLFVTEKLKLNKWGREKIRFELTKKRIDKDIIDSALSDIDDNDYQNILRGLLIKKKKEIKYSTPFELKGKLINYGIQRGYKYDHVYKLVEEILKY